MTENETTEKYEALKKIHNLLSAKDVVQTGARWILYASAAATIYIIAGEDLGAVAGASPILARLIEKIGADSLANVLERVGHEDEVQQIEEALKPIKNALSELDKEAFLTEQEFYRAIRILQKKDESRLQYLSSLIISISDYLQRLRPADPAPLSLVPKTSRPFPSPGKLVGREDALSWLRNTPGDRMLIGQPGIGKTSLLFQLAIEENGRFVVSQDRGEIAAAIANETPAMIIADDAQRNLGLLLELRQLRNETGIAFDIVASSWPSSKETVAENLSLGQAGQYELTQLTRDEMVEVVKATGLRGPDELIREIVDQAVGRPGLGQTLSLLCLNNGVQDLFSGTALRQSVVNVINDLELPRETRVILATLSFAGETGMSLEELADLLEMKVLDLWSMLDNLGGSGIIYDTYLNRVSVRPAALREALIGEVFFEGVPPLSPRKLIALLPHLASPIAATLTGVRARGRPVADELLVEILESVSSTEAWRQYAWLGRSESIWILSNHPELLITTAHPALYHAPEVAIPMLLENATGDDRLLNANPDHPLRLLEDWIKATHPNTGEALIRRKKLLGAIVDWLDAKKDIDIALNALELIMLPRFEYMRTDPGSGMTGNLFFGPLTLNELLEIEKLWATFLPYIDKNKVKHWGNVKRLITVWAYPSRVTGGQLPEDVYTEMRSFAGQMLNDIMQIAGDQPGLVHWALRIAENLEIAFGVELPREFLVLYPQNDLRDWKAAERDQKAEARELGMRWSKEEPRSVVEQVAAIEVEARNSNLSYPRWTGFVFRVIADEVESTAAWLDAFMEIDATWDIVLPLLEKATISREPGWKERLCVFLEDPIYRVAPLITILMMGNPPQALIDRVDRYLGQYAPTVEHLCLKNEVPEHTLKRLLKNENPKVARAAAWGEWNAEPIGCVRQSVEDEWRNVVVNCFENEYWLQDIFSKSSNLAYEWLKNLLSFRDFHYYEYEETIQVAIDKLSDNERVSIFALLDPVWPQSSRFVPRLVGDNIEIYRSMLSMGSLQSLHLEPLASDPNETWISKALLALDAGYTITEIAAAVVPGFYSWSGNESDMWQEWLEKFQILCKSEDARIRQIGTIGSKKVKELRDTALKRERYEAVFGRD